MDEQLLGRLVYRASTHAAGTRSSTQWPGRFRIRLRRSDAGQAIADLFRVVMWCGSLEGTFLGGNFESGCKRLTPGRDIASRFSLRFTLPADCRAWLSHSTCRRGAVTHTACPY